MKKMLLVIILSLFLCSCKKIDEEVKKANIYKEYVSETINVNEEIKNDKLDVKFEVKELSNDYLNYAVYVNTNHLFMNDVIAILVHDKESENSFPSVGIYDDKVSFDKDSEKLGIKLSGFLENNKEVNFKFMIQYNDEEGKLNKYYYFYNYRQNLT